MAENDIPITIDLDTKDAEKNLKSFEKEAAKTAEGTEKAFSGLKVAIAAALAIFASREIINGLKDIVDEASKADQAVRDLANAMAITGEFSDKAVESFTTFAGALQKTTTNTDEAILQALTLAKTFGITNDQAQTLVSTAVDLAAATGKDLNTAVQELGATYSGTAGRLGKVTPALKDLTEAQLKNGEAIDIVRKKFQGFAESSAKTFGGALTQTKNGFGEIFETLGKVITQNPIVIAIIKELGKAFFDIAEFIERNKEALTELLSQGLKGIVSYIPTVVRAFSTFLNILREVGSALILIAQGFVVALQVIFEFTKPIRDLQNILGNALLGAISKFISSILEIVKFIPGASDSLKGLGIDLDELSKTIDEFGDNRIEDALKLDTSVSDSYQKFVDETANSLILLGDSVDKSFNEAIDTAEKVTGVVGNLAIQASDRILAVGNAAVKVTKDVKNAVDEVKGFDLNKFLKDVKISLDLNTQGITSPLQSANAILDQVQGLIDSIPQLLDKITKIFNSLTDLPDRILKSVQDLAKAIPRFISEFIPNLARALPAIIKELIKAVFESIPDAIADLAKALPDIIGQLIQDFEEIIPDLVEKLAEQSPKIALALIDAFITKGGAFKIGLAITKAMSNPQLYLSIAKGFLQGIQSSGNTIANQFKSGIANVGKDLSSDFVRGVQSSLAQLYTTITSAFQTGISTIYSAIVTAFQAAYDTIVAAFSQGGENILNAFSEGAVKIRDALLEPVNRLIDFLTNFKFPDVSASISNAGGNAGSAAGGIIASVGGALGFATGGQVPAGFPNDSFPARLTSGEMVIPPGDTARLSQFLDQQVAGGGTTSEVSLTLLAQILAALQAPINVSTTAEVNGRGFADIMLQLNRNNARTA